MNEYIRVEIPKFPLPEEVCAELDSIVTDLNRQVRALLDEKDLVIQDLKYRLVRAELRIEKNNSNEYLSSE